jgi:hypothetical protein
LNELGDKAELELKRLQELVEINLQIFNRFSGKEPDKIEKIALAALLHSFYNGIENIFRCVANEFNEELPRGAHWHQQLLNSMALATKNRKAVITEQLKNSLKENLAFRHTFRSIYALEIEWGKMEQLARSMPVIFEEFKKEFQAFLR